MPAIPQQIITVDLFPISHDISPIRGRRDDIQVTATESDYIGERQIVVHRPPGFDENPKPMYDVLYFIDLSVGNADFYLPALDYLFNQ